MLLRIKLKNLKSKIVLACSVKVILKMCDLLEKGKKAWNTQVVFLELWLLLASNVLLPPSTWFLFNLFNRLAY